MTLTPTVGAGFAIDHLAGYQQYTSTLDPLVPALPAGWSDEVVAPGIARTFRPASEPYGPAVDLNSTASLGSYNLYGPSINPTTVKAALIEVDAITAESGSPRWSLGVVNADATTYAILGRDLSSVYMRNQAATGNSSGRLDHLNGDHVMRGNRAGFLIDFTKAETVAHVGYSFRRVATHLPAGDVDLRVRVGVTSTSEQAVFRLLLGKVRMTVWA